MQCIGIEIIRYMNTSAIIVRAYRSCEISIDMKNILWPHGQFSSFLLHHTLTRQTVNNCQSDYSRLVKQISTFLQEFACSTASFLYECMNACQ